MGLSESNKIKLEFLHDIWETSVEASTKTYIWAGLVKDIINGRFGSEHGDIDGFTEDLWSKRELLATLYEKKGYQVQILDEWHILRIDKNGEHAGFNRLDFDGEVAMWRHIGNGGTLYFPRDWLPDQPLTFYGKKVLISGIEFEYCIKAHPELLNPQWQGRHEDRETISWLETRLAEKGVDKEKLFERIWSYSPFLARNGFSNYWLPIVIRPGCSQAT